MKLPYSWMYLDERRTCKKFEDIIQMKSAGRDDDCDATAKVKKKGKS